MKKVTFITAIAIVALLFTACRKEDYRLFVGTWGVETIEYYNTDFAGNPIAASLETFSYDPNDTNDGIHLVFRENKTGEMRDSAVDTIWILNEETQEYDSYIYNPDTVLVTKFTYSYDKADHTLYMNMADNSRPFRLQVDDLTDNSFTYVNEYYTDYVEKAYLKRISDKPMKSGSRQGVKHPYKPGSFLGGR